MQKVFNMGKIKKAYYLFFYKLYTLFTYISESGWEDWKALLTIGVLQMYLYVSLCTWADIILKGHYPILLESSGSLFIITIIIAVSNYFILLHKNRWKKYEMEFKLYSRGKNVLINIGVFLFITLILGNLIFALYSIGQ